LALPRLIFVPGLNPKPPPESYRTQLSRVLIEGLRRARPEAAEWLARNPGAFALVAWSYLFYGAHRDITVDMPGIERLLVQGEPSAEDLRDLASWPRRVKRLTHIVGDAWPFLGRRLAQPATRRLMHEASRYLKNRDGMGDSIRTILRDALESAWLAGERVALIGHSLGSVIAYDTLSELSHERAQAESVDLFVTLGSPLATHFVQRSLQGARETGAARYPRNIRRWVNLTARGDTTALQRRLKPTFREMLDLQLVDSIEDFVDFDNYFRGDAGLNAHEAYGYLAQRLLGEILGRWLENVLAGR
jgi:PGAP1-like protein